MENVEFDIKEVLKEALKDKKHPYNKEEAFRIDVVNAINHLYKGKVFVIPEYSYGERKSIDVFVWLNNKTIAIELKYRYHNPNRLLGEFKENANDIYYKITEESSDINEYLDDISKLLIIGKDKINEKIKVDEAYAIILTNCSKEKLEDELKKYSDIEKEKIEEKLETISNYNELLENTIYGLSFNLFVAKV